MRLLLVEDDVLLGDGIKSGLTQAGYAVDWDTSGDTARAILESITYSLVVLDLALPKFSGLELLRWLRARRNAVPVLILTAFDTLEDKLRGLDLGADDYVTKPFDLKELIARVRSLLRRAAAQADSVMLHGAVALNLENRRAYLDNTEVALSQTEFTILQELLHNTGRVLSRERIEHCLYGWAEDISSNSVEVHIHNLRRKLGKDLIRTVRGVGYIVESAESDAA
ncbi:MAG: response regulator [Burkholderiales bacterium]